MSQSDFGAPQTGQQQSMEVMELFPRYVLKGTLPEPMLPQLLALAARVLADPGITTDASRKLAGQLQQQRELGPQFPEITGLCQEVLLPACHHWIGHVMSRQPPQGRGPWQPGQYGLQMIDIWLNSQQGGDYNPIHTHGGSFSGVLFLKVPPQINGTSFDGQLCFHGPEEWQIQTFRTGMAHYVQPLAGDFYLFPAWQPHSVPPFRGEGERWSIAFNMLAIPTPPARPAAMAAGDSISGNVSLSRARAKPGGFA